MFNSDRMSTVDTIPGTGHVNNTKNMCTFADIKK